MAGNGCSRYTGTVLNRILGTAANNLKDTAVNSLKDMARQNRCCGVLVGIVASYMMSYVALMAALLRLLHAP